MNFAKIFRRKLDPGTYTDREINYCFLFFHCVYCYWGKNVYTEAESGKNDIKKIKFL